MNLCLMYDYYISIYVYVHNLCWSGGVREGAALPPPRARIHTRGGVPPQVSVLCLSVCSAKRPLSRPKIRNLE